MKSFAMGIAFGMLVVLAEPPALADLALIARYDWKDGAKDVSGFPVHHDGVLETSVADGKLNVESWYGVEFSNLTELDGARQVLLRFEDITFTDLPTGGASSRYSCPIGGFGKNEWWVAVAYQLPPFGNRTTLKFNLGGWTPDRLEVEAVVADELVTHFDSIEYRFDGSAAPGERIGLRWNDGPWITAGWTEGEGLLAFPAVERVRINAGAPADWDPMNATLGPVSIEADTGPRFRRPGDGNGDQVLDLSDVVHLLGSLFLGDQPAPPCETDPAGPGNQGLLDSNGDGGVDLSDAVHVLGFLFLAGPPPVLGAGCVEIPGCPDACR
jgi:hypothetical protein